MRRPATTIDVRSLLAVLRAIADASWLPVVLFVVAPLVVFPVALLRLGLMDGGDDALSNLPFLVHSARRLLHGEILWTTDLWMGTPLIDEPEFATFYLPRLGLLLGPPTVAFGLYVAAHYVVAELGAFLYARSLGLGRAASIFAGLAYAFCGFMLGHRGHTMYVIAGAWTPFVLWGLERIEAGGGRRAFVATAVAYAAIVFSGAVQLAAYLAFMIALLYGTRAVLERSVRPLWIAAAGLVPGVLLAAVQILPSIASVPSLAADVRADYQFSTALSFDVRLLPMLVLPEPARHAELYSRCGAVVVAAAAFALIARDVRKRPIVRAWGIVAAVAFVLMLGKNVPWVARALHALPIIGVFRGPVRHNFELGTAIAMLGAFGLDAVVSGDRRALRRPIVLGGLVSIALALSALVVRRLHIADPILATVLKLGNPDIALACAFAVAFVVAGTFTDRGRLIALSALALVPLAEGRRAQRIELLPWLPVPAKLPTIDAQPGEFVRLIPPRVDEARVEALTGNSSLLIDGVQNLHGLASIAPRDVATVLDLDMHGNARDLTDLEWSRLPSIFGVTHVIMPEAVCGDVRAAIDPTRPRDSACTSGTPEGTTIERDALSCVASLGDARRHFVLTGSARRLPVGTGLPASATIFEATHRDEPALPGVGFTLGVYAAGVDGSTDEMAMRDVGSTFARFEAPVDLVRCPPRPRLLAEAFAGSVIELREAALAVAAPSTLTEMSATSSLDLEDARAHDGIIELGPSKGVAVAALWFDAPAAWTQAGAKDLELELTARAIDPQTSNVAVDLYASDEFDPESAQLVVAPGELTTVVRTLRRTVEVGPTPRRIGLRVTSEGSQRIEILRARLRTPVMHPLLVLDSREALRGSGASIAGSVLRILPGGTVMGRVALPVRPLHLTLDLEAGETSLQAPLIFGAIATGATVPIETAIPPAALVGRHRIGRTIALPADAGAASIFVRSDVPVHVLAMTARDACLDQHYRLIAPLSAGFALHRTVDPRPRAFSVTKLVSVSGPTMARAILRDAPDFDPVGTATIEGPIPTEQLHPATIVDERFDGSVAELTVDSPAGATFAVINDRWDPSWSATIDGREVPLRRANGLVRGILVPQGRHRVRMFRRVPASLWVGSGLFFLACAALWFLPRRISPWVRRT